MTVKFGEFEFTVPGFDEFIGRKIVNPREKCSRTVLLRWASIVLLYNVDFGENMYEKNLGHCLWSIEIRV